MKKHKDLWTIKRMALSVIIIPLATVSNTFGAGKPITLEQLAELQEEVFPKKPLTQKKSKRPEINTSSYIQRQKKTTQKEKNAAHKKQGGQSQQSRQQHCFAYARLKRDLATTIAEDGKSALITCLKGPADLPTLVVCPFSSQDYGDTSKIDSNISTLLSQTKRFFPFCRSIAFPLDNPSYNGAYILLYRGLIKSLSQVNTKGPGVFVLPLPTGCLLFDTAKVALGDIKITNIPEKQYGELRKKFESLTHSVVDKIDLLSTPKRKGNVKTSIENFYSLTPNQPQAIHFVSNRLLEVVSLEDSEKKRGNFNYFASCMSDQAKLNWLLDTQVGGISFLVGACKKTRLQFIYNYLDFFTRTLKEIDLTDAEKTTKVADLSSMLSQRYNMNCPSDKYEKRTPLHCILRHADGAYLKKLKFAPREQTVRALLMLMVAGANPHGTADQFGAVDQSSGMKIPAFGCTAGSIPERSVHYLQGNTSSTNGASFRFYKKQDLLTPTTLNQGDLNALKGNLQNMCGLCAFVMGSPGWSTTIPSQANLIKGRLLQETLSPLAEHHITDYLNQLQRALHLIKTSDIRDLLQFESKCPQALKDSIHQNHAPYLISTEECYQARQGTP